MNDDGRNGHMQDTINFDSGVQLYKDTRINMHEHVNLTGTCTFTPTKNHFGIEKGDKLFFRYDVVFEGDFMPDTGSRVYDNLLIMPDGSWEWVVQPYALIGYERNGKLTLVNDLVIAKPTKKESDWKSQSIIKLYDDTEIDGKKFHADFTYQNSEDIVEIIQDNGKLNLQPGDKCLALRAYIQHYNFTSTYGHDVLIIPSKYLIAKL